MRKENNNNDPEIHTEKLVNLSDKELELLISRADPDSAENAFARLELQRRTLETLERRANIAVVVAASIFVIAIYVYVAL
ncbi:hypothetical protein B6V76_18870 [Thioclava sp. IC9]|nr:hypothetical protein B6V76_18870 [Thioclava sp. IC9]